jgi:hypothetical protein
VLVKRLLEYQPLMVLGLHRMVRLPSSVQLVVPLVELTHPMFLALGVV